MEWYYAEGEEQRGPVDQETFDRLVSEGKIALTTLVWHQGLGAWQPYAEVATKPAPPGGGAPTCAECGRAYPPEDMVRYANDYVCADCKTTYFQRVQESGHAATHFEYGGFWIRLGAKIVDNIITSVVYYAFAFVVGAGAAATGEDAGLAAVLFISFSSMAIPAAYTTFFLGRYGATPGKMMTGLKVVRPNGDSLTYLRALGRYLAEILSGLIFLIGYIMAAFDEEKRTLHDRICDTRVIRTR